MQEICKEKKQVEFNVQTKIYCFNSAFEKDKELIQRLMKKCELLSQKGLIDLFKEFCVFYRSGYHKEIQINTRSNMDKVDKSKVFSISDPFTHDELPT